MIRRHVLTIIFWLPLGLSHFTTTAYGCEDLVKAVYGISSKSAPLNDLKPSAIPAWLQKHGINAVFTSAREAPPVLQALKKQGMACYQEFTVFTGRTLYRENPNWRPITAAGKEMKPDGWYHGLCPNQPELRRKRLDEFANRLQNPHLDGIWLDFIRYPVRWEGKTPRIEDSCFCEVCLKKFEDFMNGMELKGNTTADKAAFILNNHLQKWMAFRVESICSWVKEAKTIRDQKRPDVQLGLFLVPWLKEDYDNAILRIVGQDVNALSQYIDIVSPMVYHGLCYREPAWVAKVTKAIKRKSGKPVWPIIQATSQPDTLSAEEFQQTMRIASQASQTGVILFTAGHIQKENRWDQVQAVWK
ncbi:hypothetical protein GF373_09015 [bacterium]|nr:hypothetical protein [bacterium]